MRKWIKAIEKMLNCKPVIMIGGHPFKSEGSKGDAYKMVGKTDVLSILIYYYRDLMVMY